MVLPGYATAQDSALAERTRELGLDGDVRWLGWIEQADLEALYLASELLVFPSLYEGFGLPVLEAMLRGLPVACSGRGSLAEVAGRRCTGFRPRVTEQIAAAVRRLLHEETLRDELIARGREQAARFTWQACAQGYWASFARSLG